MQLKSKPKKTPWVAGIIRATTLLILIISTTGCSGLRAKSQTRQDKFEKVKVEQMVNNAVAPRPMERSRVYFNPRKETRENGTTVYNLHLEFYTVTEFAVAAGESLIIAADGKRFGLTHTNSMTAVKSRRGFTSLNYEITPQILVEIANAQEAFLRLRGTPNVIERKFSGRNKKNLKRFMLKHNVAQFVPGTPLNEPVAKKSAALPQEPPPVQRAAEEPVSKLEPNPQP